MPMDTIILKHIFYSAILFAENLYEFKTWKIVGKTIYHFFGKKLPEKFAYIKNFLQFCTRFRKRKKRDTTETKSVQLPKNRNTNLLNISRIQRLIFGVLVRGFEPHTPPQSVLPMKREKRHPPKRADV